MSVLTAILWGKALVLHRMFSSLRQTAMGWMRGIDGLTPNLPSVWQ